MMDIIDTIIVLIMGLFLGFLMGSLYWIGKFEDYQHSIGLELSEIKTKLVFVRKSIEAKERVKAKKDGEHKWEKEHQEELIE